MSHPNGESAETPRPRCKPNTDKIDPDPVAIATLVLASLSALCDIASTVREVQGKTEEMRQEESRRRVGVTLVDIEARLLDVKLSFDKLGFFTRDTPLDGPFRFGSTSIYIESSSFRDFGTEMQRLLTAIKRLHKAVEVTIWEMYERAIDWQQSPVKSLVQLREECNSIMWESRSVAEAIQRIGALIDAMVSTTRKIRVWINTPSEQ
ncbi:MAG: hypothetical protein ABL962_15135 [Fimbriimonadaceae bacterium]